MNNTADWIVTQGGSDRELASRVASALQARIATEEFSQSDVEYMQRLKLRLVEGSLDISGSELEQLRRLCQLWDVNLRGGGFASHRPFIGPVIVAFKKALFPVVRLFMKDTLRQQREFNANLIALLTDMLNKRGRQQ